MNFKKEEYDLACSEEFDLEGFEDIEELADRCKFSNCSHTAEPQCAVQKSIIDGLLSKDRFIAYYREKNEALHVAKEKNKTKAVDYMKQRKLFQEPIIKSKE